MRKWEYEIRYRELDEPVELKHFKEVGQHIQPSAYGLDDDWELLSHTFFDLKGRVILSLIFRRPSASNGK